MLFRKYWLIFLLTCFSIYICSVCSHSDAFYIYIFYDYSYTAAKYRVNCRSRHYSLLFIVSFALHWIWIHVFHMGVRLCLWITVQARVSTEQWAPMMQDHRSSMLSWISGWWVRLVYQLSIFPPAWTHCYCCLCSDFLISYSNWLWWRQERS